MPPPIILLVGTRGYGTDVENLELRVWDVDIRGIILSTQAVSWTKSIFFKVNSP